MNNDKIIRDIALITACVLLSGCMKSASRLQREEEAMTAQAIHPVAVEPTIVKLTESVRGGTYKFCDQGRAVYLFSRNGESAAINVVENAGECPPPPK